MTESDFSNLDSELLDEENQPLAKGEAQVWSCEGRGILSIRQLPTTDNLDRILKGATFLKTLDGKVWKIHGIRLCRDRIPFPHFHFDFVEG